MSLTQSSHGLSESPLGRSESSHGLSESPLGLSQSLSNGLRRLPSGAFTVAHALQLGVSHKTLQRLVRAGVIRRMQRGLYERAQPTASDAEARDPGPELVAQCCGLARPGVLAHLSAGRVHGLRTPYASQAEDERLYLLRDRSESHVRVDPRLVVLPAAFEPSHVLHLESGVAVTTLERTALDLARGCPLERALVPIDHALALGASIDVMLDIQGFSRGWPGTRVLRPAIAFANALSESGLESMVRGVCLASGLPEPTLQVPITSDSGRHYRLDLAWLAEGVVVEVDGRGKLRTLEDLHAEKAREDELRELDLHIVRITYNDLVDPNRRRLHRLARLLGTALKPYDPEWMQSQRWDIEGDGTRRARRR